jgi:hypothetical protein
MLTFLLNIMDVPHSHTGVALAKAFQSMLVTFGLQDRVRPQTYITFLNLTKLPPLQIHAVNADNASSNDTQMEALAGMANSFDEDSCVRCFNHTLQLSAKTLLRPFNAGLGTPAEDVSGGVDDIPNVEDDDDDDDDDDGDGDNKDNTLDVLDLGDTNDGIDELDSLDPDAREELLADTAALRQTVSKVCTYLFNI